MKNGTLYNKTVEILVQAYFNDTLERLSCYACAIGNIVAANNGFKLIKSIEDGENRLVWDACKGSYYKSSHGVYYSIIIGSIMPEEGNDVALGKDLIKSTGYSKSELSAIEDAFMEASKCFEWSVPGDYMFNGLCAVIDVLDKIHENTDTLATQTTKRKFVKA